MFEIKEKPKQVEKALLVGVYKDAEQKEESASLLAELESLVETLEIPVIERLLVRVQARISAAGPLAPLRESDLRSLTRILARLDQPAG